MTRDELNKLKSKNNKNAINTRNLMAAAFVGGAVLLGNQADGVPAPIHTNNYTISTTTGGLSAQPRTFLMTEITKATRYYNPTTGASTTSGTAGAISLTETYTPAHSMNTTDLIGTTGGLYTATATASGTNHYNVTNLATITGNWIRVTQNSSSGNWTGAGIYSIASTTKKNVTGNFIQNRLFGDTVASGSGGDLRGAAIYSNNAPWGTITGDFVNNSIGFNYTDAGNPMGGAVAFRGTTSVDRLYANFIGNRINSMGTAYGGAIYTQTDAKITSLESNFYGNYIAAAYISGAPTANAIAYGGAIITKVLSILFQMVNLLVTLQMPILLQRVIQNMLKVVRFITVVLSVL